MLCALAVLYLVEWQRERELGGRNLLELSNRFAEAVHSFENRFELARARWAASARSAQAAYESLGTRIAALHESLSSTAGAPGDSGELASPPIPEDPAEEEETSEKLPELPPGLKAESVVGGWNLQKIMKDQRLNPSGKRLDLLESARAIAELTRARAAMEVIDSEIRVAIFEGKERLRELGDYVEYGPGERFETAPGVLTYGEATPSQGVRMFYFFPEDFREIYDEQATKRELAERALQRVHAMLQEKEQ